MESVTQKLFTELFRPKKLDGVIAPPRIKNELSRGLVQNILLYGSPGCGKSSTARILIADYDTLQLNGSAERGIDIMRDKVVSFCSHVSLDAGAEKLKVVYIDEADGITADGWDALRNTIERYADSVRFMLTCNRIDKIPDPIRSRFNCIPFYPINKEEEDYVFGMYVKYIRQILDGVHIAADDETVTAFVRNSFPDMRSMLNGIQTLYLQGAKEMNKDSLVKTFECSDLFEKIFTCADPVENYKLVMSEYAGYPEDAVSAFSKDFVEFLRMNHPDKIQKIPYCVITIAEHARDIVNVPDKVITLLSLVYKLQTIILS